MFMTWRLRETHCSLFGAPEGRLDSVLRKESHLFHDVLSSRLVHLPPAYLGGPNPGIVPPSALPRLVVSLSHSDILQVFYHKSTGEALLTEETINHVRGLIAERGSDVWWELDESELLPESMRAEAENYEKVHESSTPTPGQM